MLSFKQWLIEGRDYTITNPKSPLEVYREVGPDTMTPSFTPDQPEDKNVYKAIYSMKQDKLYAWWVGNDYHDMVMHKKGIPDKRKSEAVDPIDIFEINQRKENIALIIYFDVKKRILEIQFRRNADSIAAKTIKEYTEIGKLKPFIAKFKEVRYVEAKHSKFRDYF